MRNDIDVSGLEGKDEEGISAFYKLMLAGFIIFWLPSATIVQYYLCYNVPVLPRVPHYATEGTIQAAPMPASIPNMGRVQWKIICFWLLFFFCLPVVLFCVIRLEIQAVFFSRIQPSVHFKTRLISRN